MVKKVLCEKQIKLGFNECKKTVMDLLVREREQLEAEIDRTSKSGDGVTLSKLIGRIELLRTLESKIFSLESFSPSPQ